MANSPVWMVAWLSSPRTGDLRKFSSVRCTRGSGLHHLERVILGSFHQCGAHWVQDCLAAFATLRLFCLALCAVGLFPDPWDLGLRWNRKDRTSDGGIRKQAPPLVRICPRGAVICTRGGARKLLRTEPIEVSSMPTLSGITRLRQDWDVRGEPGEPNMLLPRWIF